MIDYAHIEPTRDTDQHQQQKLAKKIKNFIYDPTDVIGSGFSSKVYKGINEQNNQKVAIKVIQLSKIQNEVQKYLLNNEINALRALNHKNILKTFDILMTKNNVYIVTEFCQFGDLQQMIKNNKKLNEKNALNIIRDVVQGYVAIEEKKIIHRDLKSANIFLTKTGAKIADFGFCQFIGQKKPQMNYNVGSPAYMSPQSYKQHCYFHKSDIWGIGIILYEMLIGQTPEKNLTYTEMSNNLMNGKIICEANDEVKRILTTCFKKDLNDRTDCQRLLRDINNAIQNINRKDPKGQGKPSTTQFFEQKFPKTNFPSFNGYDPLRTSTDDKQFFLQHLGHNAFSKLNEPIKGEQINRNANQTSFNQVNTFKPLDNEQSEKKLKPYIVMLQFIFRLFKYLSELSIPTLSFLRLLLFRHRSHIDQLVQSLLETYKIDPKNSELFKQFQYLKLKFDETYLDKQNSGSNLIQNNHHDLMNVMNRLANANFTDIQSTRSYKDLIRKSCQQIQSQINQNKSNSYVIWDYLLLQYEILTLYGQGSTDQTIVSQKILLEEILKQKPKNLSKNHIELLIYKTRYLFDSISSSIQFQSPPNKPVQPNYAKNMNYFRF